MFHVIAQAVDIAWLVIRLAVLVALPSALVTRLAVALVRFGLLDRAGKRHWLPCRWHRLGWKRLARNLQLAVPDKHLGNNIDSARAPKVNYPKARFWPNSFGWTVNARLTPGVGLTEFEDAAEHLANKWGCWRVSVVQRKPGRVTVRALRTDPLTMPLPASVLPPFDGRYVTLGRDEDSDMRRVSLANHSGSCWCGSPGKGKTEAGLSLACQLCPSPAVEFYIIDGGELDWAPFAPGAKAYVTELSDAVDLLHQLAAGMNERRRNLQSDLGVRNAWAVGPTPDYPLRWLLMEEAPAILQVPDKRGKRRELADEAHALVAGLLRRGRAPLYHTSLLTQKATTTGGLHPDLRDLCGLRWSFYVPTLDGAASILGADIREHPAASPTQLHDDSHVGVASVLMATGKSPFTMVKFPYVGEERADRLALELASRNASSSASARSSAPPPCDSSIARTPVTAG